MVSTSKARIFRTSRLLGAAAALVYVEQLVCRVTTPARIARAALLCRWPWAFGHNGIAQSGGGLHDAGVARVGRRAALSQVQPEVAALLE